MTAINPHPQPYPHPHPHPVTDPGSDPVVSTCPNVVITPGSPGSAPATWDAPVTLSTADLVGFGTSSTGGKVSLKCSNGTVLVDALAIVSWTPQQIVCTLPAKSTVTPCDAPLYYELTLTLPTQADVCGPYMIDIIGTIDPTQPSTVDPNDLTQLAHGFTISVTIPRPEPQVGVPARVQLLPPVGSNLSFTGVNGVPLPLSRKWNPPVGPIRLQALEVASAASGGRTPPMVVRSEHTYSALRSIAAADAPLSAALPPPGPSVTVEVKWSVVVFTLFGESTVQQGTLFSLVNPDDPAGGAVPTLESLLLGVVMRPWVAAETSFPPAQPLKAVSYYMHASIRLSVGSVHGDWVDLPNVQLPVPTLFVPVVLLLFRDSTFTGRVLPCLPANRAHSKITELRSKLIGVRDALGTIYGIASVALWLAGLDQLLDLLPADENTAIAFADTNGKIDLDNIELDHSVLPWNWGDWDWEDEVSSIFLFGPPAGYTINNGNGPTGSSVAFYSAEDWNTNEGQYNLDIGLELCVAVPNLSSKNPASLPAGALSVIHGTTDDNFNDVLSTLKFL